MTRRLKYCSGVVFLLFASARNAEATAFHGFVTSNTTGMQVEYFSQKPPGTGPFPVLFLLHPDQDSPKIGGQVFVDNGQLDFWSGKGFLTVAISQPGFGHSEGKSDFCGPQTQNAVLNVITHFRSLPEARPQQFFIYGGSRGAVVASMIATVDHEVRGFILKSGVYNFPEWVKSRPWYDPIKLAMHWEIGWLSEHKLQERSAFFDAGKIKAPVLLIHGSLDDRAPLQIAEEFTNSINSSGGNAQLKVIESEHVIPMSSIQGMMEDFLKANLVH